MHYFEVFSGSEGFNIAFGVPSAESPTSVANNVFSFIKRNLADTWIPCSGTARTTSDSSGVKANKMYVLSKVKYTYYGADGLCGYGTADTGSGLWTGDFVSTSFKLSSIQWTHSIEI